MKISKVLPIMSAVYTTTVFTNVGVLASIKAHDLTELQCTLMDDFVFFDLRDLESSDSDQSYTVTTTNSTGTMTTTLTYQFCEYTTLASQSTYAYMD